MPSNVDTEESMSATASGVTWDLSRFFPAFDGPEMQQFKKALADDIASMRQKAGALGPLDAETAAAWEAVVLTGEDLGLGWDPAWPDERIEKIKSAYREEIEKFRASRPQPRK